MTLTGRPYANEATLGRDNRANAMTSTKPQGTRRRATRSAYGFGKALINLRRYSGFLLLEDGSQLFKDLVGLDGSHAGVRFGAAFVRGHGARAAQDGERLAVRAGRRRIRRAVDRHPRLGEGRGDVQRSAVHADQDRKSVV